MNTLIKKALVTFSTAMILISLITVSASANTPLLYDFGCFTGEETVSIDLQGDYTKFVRLEDENGKIDPQNYTVSGDKQHTAITLKEEYLNNLENGEYKYKSYFENTLLTYEFDTVVNVGILVPASNSSEFANLVCGETEVEKSNYDVEKTTEGFLITINNEFLQTLPESTKFYAHYYDNNMSYINLQVDKQEAKPTLATEAATETTTTTETTTAKGTTNPTKATDEQQTLVFPKTGDNSSIMPIISVMLLSACVLTLGIISRNRSNKRNN